MTRHPLTEANDKLNEAPPVPEQNGSGHSSRATIPIAPHRRSEETDSQFLRGLILLGRALALGPPFLSSCIDLHATHAACIFYVRIPVCCLLSYLFMYLKGGPRA